VRTFANRFKPSQERTDLRSCDEATFSRIAEVWSIMRQSIRFSKLTLLGSDVARNAAAGVIVSMPGANSQCWLARVTSHPRGAACRGLAVIWLVLGCCIPGASGNAQEAPSGPIVNDEASPEVSRDEWRLRIETARQRAREAARDRRLHPERYPPPPPEDPAIVATERVMRDESLRPGDIIATKKGLFVYRGRSDLPRSEADFIALPAR
jgi:hypothetical protein